MSSEDLFSFIEVTIFTFFMSEIIIKYLILFRYFENISANQYFESGV
jgi:hypothetical protein